MVEQGRTFAIQSMVHFFKGLSAAKTSSPLQWHKLRDKKRLRPHLSERRSGTNENVARFSSKMFGPKDLLKAPPNAAVLDPCQLQHQKMRLSLDAYKLVFHSFSMQRNCVGVWNCRVLGCFKMFWASMKLVCVVSKSHASSSLQLELIQRV